MKFFTIAVLLAGVSNLAEAWQLIAYEKDYSCNGGGRNRVLTGDTNACMTFGRDMPGTGCKECGNGNGGCVGAFTPRSVGLGGNDDCILYNQNDCQGNSVWNVRGQSPGCKSVGDVVRSYKCANANGCRNRDEYSRCLAVCQTGCSFPGAVLGCAGACINSCHGAWGNAGC